MGARLARTSLVDRPVGEDGRGEQARRRPPLRAPIGAGRPVGVVLVIIVGLMLIATGPVAAHTDQGSATPGNNAAHPWPSDGCSTPGARISTVPGIFDFTHACIHHDGCYTGFPRDGRPTYWVSRLQCDGWFLGDLQASCR
ncbi:MAG TPA: hypothetical protein VIU11_00290 [Nakamurella sp.]